MIAEYQTPLPQRNYSHHSWYLQVRTAGQGTPGSVSTACTASVHCISVELGCQIGSGHSLSANLVEKDVTNINTRARFFFFLPYFIKVRHLDDD